MNGIPAGPHLGKTVCEISGKAADAVEPMFQHVLATGQPVLEVEIAAKLLTREEVGCWVENYFPIHEEVGRVRQVGVLVAEVSMQKRLDQSLRNPIGKEPRLKGLEKDLSATLGEDAHKNSDVDVTNSAVNPLKLLPGISFSLLFRFLLVSRIYRGRMALFCRKNYGLEPNLLLILTAASEGHLRQGTLARSLGIHKNAMVFLIDKLELLRLIKRVANPDNRREKLIECTAKGSQLVTEIKTRYPEIVRWGLYPLTDSQIEQFGTLLARIVEGESLPKPAMPLVHRKKAKRIATPSVTPA